MTVIRLMLLALLWPLLAGAQVLELTPDTACGAPGVGTVRVQTALHSYVDVTLPVAGSNAWSRATGWRGVSS